MTQSWLAGAPRQRRRSFVASSADILSTDTSRIAGMNKWRIKIQIVNRGPQAIVMAETAIKCARGEGVFLEPNQQPFIYESPGELHCLSLPTDTIIVGPAGALLTWTPNPIDFLVWSPDPVVSQVSIAEEIEA